MNPPPVPARKPEKGAPAAADISGLPADGGFEHPYRDVRMDTAKTMATAGLPDVHMATAKGYTFNAPDDVRMDTARGSGTLRGGGFQLWEKELLESNEVKRKATVAQLCECVPLALATRAAGLTGARPVDVLDYYFQLLGYIGSRKERRAAFDAYTAQRALAPAAYAKELKSYCGRERVLLRKRRTKLRVDQFHIIAQVGQGGYGEVFLARKQESGEVCALKKMRKRTLAKMNEVRSWPARVCQRLRAR